MRSRCLVLTLLLSLAFASTTAFAGLVAYWPFEEGVGTTTENVVQASADTFVNTPTWISTGLPTIPDATTTAALDFAGGDHIRAANSYTGVTGTNPRTMTAWIRTSSNGNQDILSWGSNTTGRKWVFRVQTGGDGQNGALRVEVAGGYIIGHQPVGDGQWHHVAATWEDDGTPGVEDLQLYVDGVPQSTTGLNPEPIDTASGADVRIASEPWNTGRPFNGAMDDVRIYDDALSAAEIRLLATGSSDVQAGILHDANVDTDAVVWEDLVVVNQTSPGSLDLNLTGVTHDPSPPTGLGGITGSYVFNGSSTAAFANGNIEAAYQGNPTDIPVSMEVLFRPDDLLGQEVIWEFGGATDGSSLTLNGGVLQFIAKDGGVSGALSYDLDTNDDGISEVGDFIHVITVADVAANRVNFYLNGSSIAPGGLAVGGAFDDWAGNNDSGLGNRYSATGGSGGAFGDLSGYGGFGGHIARFAFYDHAITDEEALYIMQTSVSLPEPATLALVALGVGLLRRRRR
jgi:hypothetical protein